MTGNHTDREPGKRSGLSGTGLNYGEMFKLFVADTTTMTLTFTLESDDIDIEAVRQAIEKLLADQGISVISVSKA